jgi:hypothetical protein
VTVGSYNLMSPEAGIVTQSCSFSTVHSVAPNVVIWLTMLPHIQHSPQSDVWSGGGSS